MHPAMGPASGPHTSVGGDVPALAATPLLSRSDNKGDDPESASPFLKALNSTSPSPRKKKGTVSVRGFGGLRGDTASSHLPAHASSGLEKPFLQALRFSQTQVASGRPPSHEYFYLDHLNVSHS